MDDPGRGSARFALVVSAILCAVGLAIAGVQVRDGASPALLALGPALAFATYRILARLARRDRLPTTVHQYGLYADGPAGGPPRVEALARRLEARGYELEIHVVNELGEVGPKAAADCPLVGVQLRLRDRRAAAAGEVALRLREEDGRIVGAIEAGDRGPGLYDELAQYAIVDLGALIAGLEYLPMVPNAERRPAPSLAAELPERPYGLALIGTGA